MKKIITPERFKGLNTGKELWTEMEKCYQEVLDYLTKVIGPVADKDDVLLAAALEKYAEAIKSCMRPEDLFIYKELKGLKVSAIGITIKEEK